jgi:4a-hydroxytetrahydrobiopterin dehydratase
MTETLTSPAPVAHDSCEIGQVYSKEDREKALATLDGWEYVADVDAIRKTFKYPKFHDALGFVTRVALISERINHHPETLCVHSKKTVELMLTTHRAGGFTDLDVKLAGFIDGVA